MASHIGSEERVAFVAETESGDRIGCILGMLGESSLSMAVPEKAGGITVCWVEEHAQRQGVGRSLLEAVEAWFLDRNVRHLEVSYMTGNETAAAAWEHLGFKPFRAFAYKEI
jgi:GNAT superfamily N-acetyltransferase